ncbi:hypothetical protein KJZ67_05535 [Patescibacteria group bacterium]|nr:hypothetical protein [Patescibacteria group bacterium]
MKELAQVGDIVGSIESPLSGTGYGSIQTGAVGMFITNILRLAFVAAGVYALFNFIIAGYNYMNAAGDSKKLAEAWSRIWQSLLGLVIIVGSFAIASLFGHLIFGRADFILNPTIYGPNE